MQALVGIARMAAQSPTLEAKSRVEYFELASGKLLAQCDSARMPFAWSINPYRGCEYGCKYCYARYTHEFMELRGAADFETKIFAKHFSPVSFLHELRVLPHGETIAIGSGIREIGRLRKRYGHGRWRKRKGYADVRLSSGEIVRGELHWY